MIRVLLLCAICAVTALVPALAHAAFPGKPGPIAYPKVRYDVIAHGVGGLFTHGPRVNQQPRQLTANIWDERPAYSADGRWFVLVSRSDLIAPGDIYVMRRDGSERRQLVAGGSDPAFFPSGKAIVFVRPVEGRRQVFTVRLSGNGLRQLTTGPSESFDPAVSPNGRRIAFSSDIDPRRGDLGIFTMRPDGGELRPVIDGPRSELEPDWAPDGRRIAYVVGGGSSSDLLVAKPRGGRPLNLTPCQGSRCRDFSHPAFSPNGRHVVALSKSTRRSGIEVFRSDGKGTHNTFDKAGFGIEGEESFVGAPTWGPRPR